jgi:hypothetical protein
VGRKAVVIVNFFAMRTATVAAKAHHPRKKPGAEASATVINSVPW